MSNFFNEDFDRGFNDAVKANQKSFFKVAAGMFAFVVVVNLLLLGAAVGVVVLVLKAFGVL